MRHLILCALLAAPAAFVSAAEDGAFGALVRKPANSVCVFDSNAVDPSKQPVEIAGSNGQPVLVGACSEACQNKLHGMLGANGYAVAAAATSNTTLAKMQAAAPAALPAPRPATAPAAAPAPLPLDRGFAPAPGKQETYGKVHNQPKTVAPAPVDETSPAHAQAPKRDKPVSNISNLRGDQSDERQREKKAAQRRDAGKSAETPAPSEKKSTAKKPAAKTRSEHPAEAPVQTEPVDNGFQR